MRYLFTMPIITYNKNNEPNITYQGLVVGLRSSQDRIMSDVWSTVHYATVYNGTGFQNVCYRTEEFDYDQPVVASATVDAPEELVELYHFWCMAKKYGETLASYDVLQTNIILEQKTPNKGKYVKVVKGKKVPLGTEGMVFWEGVDNWGNKKVGIALSPEKNIRGGYVNVAWTATSNCKVIEKPTHWN